MNIINHLYLDKQELTKFVKEYDLDNKDNVLVQIFSSNATYNDLINIKSQVEKLLPFSKIIGSSTAGIIADGKIIDNEVLISFSIFEKSTVKVKSYKNFEHKKIIEDLKSSVITDDSKLLLCFANTYTFQSEEFLLKLSKEFPKIKVAGGNSADDYRFERCYVFSNDGFDSDVVFASIDSKVLHVEEKYILNWLCLGKELTITKSQKNVVSQIDNKNISEIYKYYLGEDISNDLLLYAFEFPLIFKHNNLEVARAPIGINEDGSMIYGGDIEVGTKVRFAYADIDFINQYNKNQLLKEINSKNEAIYIYSCSARRSMLGTYLDDEVNILNSGGKTAGFVTYGEFFYNNECDTTDLLNVTTTYLLLNENEILPVENLKSSSSQKTSSEIRMKALTTFLRKTKQEELEIINDNLLSEQNKLTIILDNIPDLVWIKDPNGVYITCNRRFEDLFGIKKELLIGKRDYDFVNKELADFFRENDLKALNSNIPLSNYENLTFVSDGHEEYTLTTKTKVLNKDGTVLGVLGIGNNVSDLIVKEKKLSEQKEELETIFNTTKDGLALMDRDTNFLRVNDAYTQITGLTKEELLKTSCLALTMEEDKEKAKDVFARVLKNEHVDDFEKICVIKDKRVIVNMSISLMPNAEHILVSTKDISKKKIFEEQAKLASMGEMIGNIAHQWRQPLSVITTIASGVKFRIENALDDYSIMEGMDSIMKQANYLSKTIDDFRDFIKDNHEKNQISIVKTIEKTMTIIHPSLKNNDIELITDLNDNIVIDGFENEIIQALINIINNAKDAIKDNNSPFEERIILIKTVRSKNGLDVVIRDNGKGIPQNIISRIFEPYFTTKHKSMGTGIGLSLVHKIFTEHHYGQISVKNEKFIYNDKEHYGACFIISFEESN